MGPTQCTDPVTCSVPSSARHSHYDQYLVSSRCLYPVTIPQGTVGCRLDGNYVGCKTSFPDLTLLPLHNYLFLLLLYCLSIPLSPPLDVSVISLGWLVGELFRAIGLRSTFTISSSCPTLPNISPTVFLPFG